jgi:hypothetical protein
VHLLTSFVLVDDLYSTVVPSRCKAKTKKQELVVHSPATLVACQTTLLSWGGGTGPYRLSVIRGGQAHEDPLRDFGEISTQALTWSVDVPIGTSITLKLTDSTGETVYSSPVTAVAGSAACLPATMP